MFFPPKHNIFDKIRYHFSQNQLLLKNIFLKTHLQNVSESCFPWILRTNYHFTYKLIKGSVQLLRLITQIFEKTQAKVKDFCIFVLHKK